VALSGTWKSLGDVAGRKLGPRTTTDGLQAAGTPPAQTAKSVFNFFRHRWLCRVVRDDKLPGAAHRTAVLLWELQNAERRCAWPSLAYLARQLKMHKSTVIRSLDALRRRGWIITAHRGGRQRTNEYRLGLGLIETDEDVSP
jgi:biotin operon repressor